MPEESVGTNESMVNDFMGDLVPQDIDSGETVAPAQKPAQQPAQPTSQTPNNGSSPTNTNNAQNPVTPEVKPFDDQFFVVEKNGNKVFDANKALGFFQQQNTDFQHSQSLGKVFNPQPQQPAQPQIQPNGQPPVVDNRPEWEKQLDEEVKAKEEYRNKQMAYRGYLTKALEEGYQGDQAFARADQLAAEQAEREYMRTSYQKQFEARESARKQQEEQQRLAQIEPMSRVNIAKAAAEFGGVDSLNAFLFGVPDGKGGLANGFGLDAINFLFDVAHEGKEMPTDPSALGELYKKWWTKVTSNENNLRFIVDYAKSKMQAKLFPNIVDHINSVKQGGDRQMKVANQGAMSQVNKSHGASRNALDDYLGRNYDTI